MLEPSQDGGRQRAQFPCHSFAPVLLRVALLNYTSRFTSAKWVKIHEGLCVTGGRLYHVILEVSAARKDSTDVLARCMPTVGKLWQAAIQGIVDTLACCNYVIMCFCLFGSSTWWKGTAVSCVLCNGIFARISSLVLASSETAQFRFWKEPVEFVITANFPLDVPLKGHNTNGVYCYKCGLWFWPEVIRLKFQLITVFRIIRRIFLLRTLLHILMTFHTEICSILIKTICYLLSSV